MNDGKTFYLVNGQRKRTNLVETNPDVLKYNLWESERGKSADELLQQSLQKVRGSVWSPQEVAQICEICDICEIGGIEISFVE